MTTSKDFSSRTLNTVISSDMFREIRPDQIEFFRGLPENDIFYSTPVGKMKSVDEKSTPGISAMSLLKITNGDIVRIVEKIQKIILNSSDGVSYTLDNLFTSQDKKQMKYPIPGTLRIFSSDRCCYYTGRSWKRINLIKST